ncbi:Acyl-CoA--sterol O-acyltransferase 1 [Acorus calamus]|uniref:Phytosulfokine n=1 Tax=Acorus calamus TaxID=4465 RepID=A0AAV9DEI2_ACOCL|nr:Acyl-CoA--sterol O-acyltransferase 1 [Acorus calamus]
MKDFTNLHVYLALDIVLSSAAWVARVLIWVEIEPQTDAQYLASSLREFWGRQWNLMVTRVLRPTAEEVGPSHDAALAARDVPAQITDHGIKNSEEVKNDVEGCGNGEECLMRRTLVDHIDYIYSEGKN